MSFFEFLTQMIEEKSVEFFLLLLVVVVLLMLLVAIRRVSAINKNKKNRKIFSGVVPAKNPSLPKQKEEEQIEPKLFTQSNTQLSQLIDIEEALLALRELYQRKLIDADLYVQESMKYAAKLNFAEGTL
jgi:hypothetical protein